MCVDLGPYLSKCGAVLGISTGGYAFVPKKKVAKAPTKPNLIVHNTHKKEEKIVYTVIPTPKKPDNKRDSRGYSYTIKY